MTRRLHLLSAALLCLAICCGTSFASEDVPWPMFRHDAGGAARAEYIGADVSALKWSFPTDGEMYSSAILGSDGRIYFGSTDGKIYCVSGSGTLLWAFDTKGTVKHSAPAIGPDGTIYATCYNNGSQPEALQGLLALNADGALRWRCAVTVSPLHAPVVAPSGDICFGSNGGGVFCVSPEGTLKWQYGNYKVFPSAPVFADSGVMYVADISGRLHAVGSNGLRLWAVNMAGMADRTGCAVGSDGRIYVGAADGKLYSFLPSGAVAWTCRLGGPIYSSPALGSDCAYMTAGDGRVHAVGFDGVQRWAAPVRHPQSSPCVDYAGKIYVGTQCFSAAGSLLSDYEAAPVTSSSPSVGFEGTVYVGAGADMLALSTGPVPQPQFNHPPTCRVEAAPTSGRAPLNVMFAAEASDPDGDPLTAEWDFGDGSTATGMSVGHCFAAAGSYTVALTVRDGRGGTAAAEVFIEVAQPNLPPTVTLSATPTEGKAPLVVGFTAKAEDPEGGALTIVWDFGDGAVVDGGLTAEHLYSSEGGYCARVTVIDDAGAAAGADVVIVATKSNGQRNRQWGLIKRDWEKYLEWLQRWLERGKGRF